MPPKKEKSPKFIDLCDSEEELPHPIPAIRTILMKEDHGVEGGLLILAGMLTVVSGVMLMFL